MADKECIPKSTGPGFKAHQCGVQAAPGQVAVLDARRHRRQPTGNVGPKLGQQGACRGRIGQGALDPVRFVEAGISEDQAAFRWRRQLAIRIYAKWWIVQPWMAAGACCQPWKSLYPAALGHRGRGAVPDDEMVEDADIGQGQRLLEPGGHRTVGGAGFTAAAGMVVRQDDGGGVMGQAALEHLARMYLGAVEGAAEQFFESYHAMPGVEEQAGEHFVRQGAQSTRDEFSRLVGIGKCVATDQGAGDMAV